MRATIIPTPIERILIQLFFVEITEEGTDVRIEHEAHAIVMQP